MSEEYATARVATVESKRGEMQHAYREMLSRHMIAVMLATSACIVGVFVVVGPMGTQEALTPLQRLVFGAVYAAAGWPICYSMNLVALYFLRFRALPEIAAALPLLALFEAFPCSAIAYTVDSLVHPQPTLARHTTQGFLELYLLVATIAVASSLLYVVYQRLSRSAAPGAVTTGNGNGTGAAVAAAAEQEVDNAVEVAVLPDPAPSGGEFDNESASGNGDEPPSREPPDGDEAEHPSGSNGTSVAPTASDPPDAVSTPSSPPNAEAPPALQPEIAPRLAALGDRTSARELRQHATILTMLPANLGTDVIYLKSEDHYIDVRTTVGQSLVKMRFSDAVADLGDRGIQVHRSYWVATRLDQLAPLPVGQLVQLVHAPVGRCMRRGTGPGWATARAMRGATVTTPTRTASRSGCTCAHCAAMRGAF